MQARFETRVALFVENLERAVGIAGCDLAIATLARA